MGSNERLAFNDGGKLAVIEDVQLQHRRKTCWSRRRSCPQPHVASLFRPRQNYVGVVIRVWPVADHVVEDFRTVYCKKTRRWFVTQVSYSAPPRCLVCKADAGTPGKEVQRCPPRSAVHHLADQRYRIRRCACSTAVTPLL